MDGGEEQSPDFRKCLKGGERMDGLEWKGALKVPKGQESPRDTDAGH